MDRDTLVVALKTAQEALANAHKALDAFDALPENNVFDDLKTAAGKIENKLLDQAHNDCEGSHNFGRDEYTQEFIVGGVHYVGVLKCEYNRHDKTYYYVDGHEFTYTKKE